MTTDQVAGAIETTDLAIVEHGPAAALTSTQFTAR